MVSLAFKTQEQIIDQSSLVSWVSGIHGNLLHSLNTKKIKTSNLTALIHVPLLSNVEKSHSRILPNSFLAGQDKHYCWFDESNSSKKVNHHHNNNSGEKNKDTCLLGSLSSFHFPC